MVQGVEDAEQDMPVTLLYSIDDPNIATRATSKTASKTSARDRNPSPDCLPVTCTLEGTTGIPPGHPIAVTSLGTEDEDSWLAPLVRQALDERTAIVAPLDDFKAQSLQGVKWRGHGGAPVCVLRSLWWTV